MTEYVLQKKLLGRWDYVTWYDESELDKAQRSFESMTKGDTGYSWRLVKLETLQEKLLMDHSECPKGDDEANTVAKAEASGGWTKSSQQTNWSSPAPKSNHGMVGSVWVGNPTTKEKKRVPAAEAATMLENGWVKAGPRTQL